MSLIDQIEMLGIAAEEGLIDRDEAARLLAEYSDGGLTLLGAQDAIANHRTRRETYEQLFNRAARAVTVLTAVVAAETPEEKAAAEAASIAWRDQEEAHMRSEILAYRIESGQ